MKPKFSSHGSSRRGLCSFVVNFDLPYNVLQMVQRIMRSHRPGQQNDVVVLNFLNKSFFMDSMRVDVEAEEVIKQIADATRLTAEITRQLAIEFGGV